jgi:hypothetical protein
MHLKLSLAVRFCDKNFVCVSHLPHAHTHSAYLIHLELITQILFGEEQKL